MAARKIVQKTGKKLRRPRSPDDDSWAISGAAVHNCDTFPKHGEGGGRTRLGRWRESEPKGLLNLKKKKKGKKKKCGLTRRSRPHYGKPYGIGGCLTGELKKGGQGGRVVGGEALVQNHRRVREWVKV